MRMSGSIRRISFKVAAVMYCACPSTRRSGCTFLQVSTSALFALPLPKVLLFVGESIRARSLIEKGYTKCPSRIRPWWIF